jgi:gamma-glutamylcyclotransferase (GGCT)/AIG2-like uncharacterized protein YtfP
MITAIFVYGTLKRRQCRCQLWPVEPLAVQQAWSRGILFDRRDYPAMTAGDDRVLGELWKFREPDVPPVLAALDQIEGTNQIGHKDLYRRVVVEIGGLDDQSIENAYAYHYATDPRLDGFAQLRPRDIDSYVQWPAT